ncbi:MAG: SH3 domain-containing protein [Burkholderiales bacterium]
MQLRWRRWIVAAGLAWATGAAAQTAVTTSAVNVRAGPDRSFPLVTWLRGGTPVTVMGCLDGWRWCDVIAGRDRGWVHASYLAFPWGGSTVTILNGGPTLGLPLVTFSVGSYWGAHYRGRPWFPNQRYWDSRWQRHPPPPVWRPPPPRPPAARPPSSRPPSGSRPPGGSGRPPSGRPPQQTPVPLPVRP